MLDIAIACLHSEQKFRLPHARVSSEAGNMDVNMNHISMEAASEQKNDSGASNQRLTKNQKRRLKKKQKKQQAKQDAQNGIQEQQPDHKSDEVCLPWH